MSRAQCAAPVSRLAEFGNVVPDGYAYRPKRISPQEDLRLPEAWFKWYDLAFPDVEITAAQRAEARALVAAEAARLRLPGELGFVILHRAGSVLLLLVSTWRHTNEIWESIHVKVVEGGNGYRPLEFDQSHRGTFCVWELGVVWHERNAWTRFLS